MNYISLNKNGPTFTENIWKKIKNILHNFASIQVYLNQLWGLREDTKVYKADDANGSLRHITISHSILGLSRVKTGERLLYAICIKVSKRKKMGYLK